MVIKTLTTQDYENSYNYTIIVETASSSEKDIILKHLELAKEEYSSYLRKFTKGE